MANFLHRLSHWYRLRSIGPRDIARVCGGVLKEVGLSVPGTVLELRNSSTHAGWLINLKAPQDFSLPAVEKLVRIFHDASHQSRIEDTDGFRAAGCEL